MREHADVVVIGGGPAGTTAATMLKKYAPSRRIVLVEQARFPRHHIGESTLPEMNAVLRRLGVLRAIDEAGFVRKVGVTYRWAKDRPYFSDVFSTGVLDAISADAGEHIPDYAWQIDRARYDTILLEHARASGVEVVDGRVAGVLRSGHVVTGVSLANGREIDAGHVVDCSGQSRVVSRALGLSTEGHPLGDFAIYRYYEGFRWDGELLQSPQASKIFFSATRAGWMWFIPLSERTVSVGLVTRREFMADRDPSRLFDEEMASIVEIASMLEPACMAMAPGEDGPPETRTIVDWSYSHDMPAGPGFYLAGDAAAFVDPILSSGVLLAHHSGLAAANAINTEWMAGGLSAAELADGYAAFYRDLYGGFLAMARWWYDRRDVGVDDWLRLAAELGRKARGSRERDETDTRAFMTFAAGFLTDYRFVNFGCGFGDSGIVDAIEGIEGSAPSVAVRREIPDREACLSVRHESVEVGAYLATDVESDRWWRLPEIRFRLAGGTARTYRPPVPLVERETFWLSATLRIVDRLLRACDGRTTVDHAVRATRDGFEPGRRRDVQRLANLILSDLRLLEVVGS
jgi:flavin-dependent dehydrogenase